MPAGSGPVSSPPRPVGPVSPPRQVGPVLRRAQPLHLDIPSIGVSTELLQLGLNADRTVQVPPLGRHSAAGWYRYSPTPGQLGPSVILGHVDSAAYGPAVFFRLGAIRPGDLVDVRRADATVAVFRVDRVVSYPKDHFPTLAVYGNTDNAALRLITCGGRFDFSTHNYESNIVAYASLVSSHPA
jgi:sortase (surface protein transpeptidase)